MGSLFKRQISNIGNNSSTLRHVLSGCKLGLHGGRYTWRHDQVLRVISKALEDKFKDVNAGKLLKKQGLEEVRFQKEGARGIIAPLNISQKIIVRKMKCLRDGTKFPFCLRGGMSK